MNICAKLNICTSNPPTSQSPKPLAAIMTDRKLKITFGLLTLGLLGTLLLKLTKVPGGMILSGLVIGIMYLIIIVLGCLIFTGIIRQFYKKTSFGTILLILTTISFTFFHYQLYSPTLTIKVPNGYKGEINLVLSNLDNNELTIDSNGIGYLNKWTFNKTYSKPIVEQLDGKNLDKNLVGFNPSTFFGKGKSCCISGQQLESLSFKIVPDDKIGQEQFYSNNFMDFVDKKIILLSKSNSQTVIDSVSVERRNEKK